MLRHQEGVIMAFKKAERTQLYLRCALFGPSGSGKTMTALRIIGRNTFSPDKPGEDFGISLYDRLTGGNAAPATGEKTGTPNVQSLPPDDAAGGTYV
jgi:GTPase SAR1 family protein